MSTGDSTGVYSAGAGPNAIFEMWHREEGGSFIKIYSNQNDGSALINRPRHPDALLEHGLGISRGRRA